MPLPVLRRAAKVIRAIDVFAEDEIEKCVKVLFYLRFGFRTGDHQPARAEQQENDFGRSQPEDQPRKQAVFVRSVRSVIVVQLTELYRHVETSACNNVLNAKI